MPNRYGGDYTGELDTTVEFREGRYQILVIVYKDGTPVSSYWKDAPKQS